jgi:hypothetical protein
MLRYLNSFWAVADIVSVAFTAAWIGWYMFLVFRDLQRDKASASNNREPGLSCTQASSHSSQTLLPTTRSVNAALSFNIDLEVWQFAGILCCGLIGLRVLK